jgi:hypothetical protein
MIAKCLLAMSLALSGQHDCLGHTKWLFLKPTIPKSPIIAKYTIQKHNLTSTLRGWIRLYRITAYNPNSGQTDRTPNIASCGRVRSGTIALSRDLFYRHGVKRCGEKVKLFYLISGKWVYETWTIWDTMSARFSRSADRMIGTNRTAAMAFGVRQGQIQFTQ